MTTQEKLSFSDMMTYIDSDMRQQVTDILLTTDPIRAMCTLASCLGVISVMASDADVAMTIHNIDEMAAFAKAMAYAVIETTDQSTNEALNISNTKH